LVKYIFFIRNKMNNSFYQFEMNPYSHACDEKIINLLQGTIIQENINEIPIGENIINNEIPEEIEDTHYTIEDFTDIPYEENDILEIPITRWDPDSYYIDYLDRHYAATLIQERWREYFLYR
jgi:hypothetical protein